MKLKLSLSKTRAALLLLTLAIACGDDINDGKGAEDGGDSAGGGNGSQGDGSDGDNSSDGDNASDGGGGTDGDNSADAGDGATGGSTTIPTVLTTLPADGATAVAVNGSISATFSEAMDPKTLTASTFTVTSGAMATPVPGTVIYSSSEVEFWPAAYFANDVLVTASISAGAKSASGIALAAPVTWTFTTGAMLAAGKPVKLGTAANYAILSKTGISSVAISPITGDIAVSPITSTAITGFSLSLHSTNLYATSTQVTGKVYAPDYKAPTPAVLTTAISDMQTALTDAASRAPDKTELGAGKIGGLTFAPGVYKWGTGVLIETDVTLEGGASDVWIFQIAKGLTVSSGAKVLLKGAAVPKNIFWQVTEAVDLGTTAHLEGVVLSAKAITLRTMASINGQLLAKTAVVLDKATVKKPL